MENRSTFLVTSGLWPGQSAPKVPPKLSGHQISPQSVFSALPCDKHFLEVVLLNSYNDHASNFPMVQMKSGEEQRSKYRDI